MMKYVFIVNPASGQGKHGGGLISQIEKLISEHPDKDISICYTANEKDAIPLADRIAGETEGEVVVFACGGDGTIQEVVNGLYGHDNAALAVIPAGSGNDFVRALGGGVNEGEKFLDLAAHLDAPIRKIDLIKMTWDDNGVERSWMVDNGINIGFDGNAAITAHEVKALPGVSGTGSYIVGVAKNLILKKGENLHIVADDKEFFNGPLLLMTAANGGFCGGGFESCPNADLSDGLMELLAINNMSRVKFISLVPKYQKGKILEIDNPREQVYKYTQAKKIVIEPNAAPFMTFVADGEIFTTGKLTLEIVPDAMKVVAC